jgi:hypothetical protein
MKDVRSEIEDIRYNIYTVRFPFTYISYENTEHKVDSKDTATSVYVPLRPVCNSLLPT